MYIVGHQAKKDPDIFQLVETKRELKGEKNVHPLKYYVNKNLRKFKKKRSAQIELLFQTSRLDQIARNRTYFLARDNTMSVLGLHLVAHT